MHQIAPPEDDKLFELLVRDLFNASDKDSSYFIYGKSGQEQNGVDIYSHPLEIAIQAKKKDIINRGVKSLQNELKKNIDDTIKKSEKFPHKIKKLVIASTFKNDVTIQNYCFKKSETLGFEIEYWGWDSIKEKIFKYEELLKEYYKPFIRYVDTEQRSQEADIKKIRRAYSEVDDYIKRGVSHLGFEFPYSFLNEKKGEFLYEVVKKNKKVLLLSPGGIGKSVELKNLAFYFSNNESLFFPIKISLKDYVNSIEELLTLENSDWENIPQEKLLIILDSLDEVNESRIDISYSAINNLSKKYPHASIVVACRSNIYDVNHKPLEKFEIYYPNDLSDIEIKEYVSKKLVSQAPQFFKEITKKNLKELLKVPFNLKYLVRFFEQGVVLPKKKSEIYDLIFKQVIEEDLKKYNTSGLKINERSVLFINGIMQLALSMESLEKNWISDEEFQKVIADYDTRNLIIHCSLINKSLHGSAAYSFENNTFQEFLAAKLLANQDYETISKFTYGSTNAKKIKRSWVNTLSFLIEMLPSNSIYGNKIIRHLIENDIQSLIRIETDKISEEKRERIFFEIVKNDWENNISLYSNNFSISDLSIFSGQSKNIASFLINEIEKPRNYESKVDALLLLGSFKSLPFLRNKAKNVLLSVVENKSEKIHTRKEAIIALGKLGFSDPAVMKKICTLKFDEHGYLGEGVFKYILFTNSADRNVNVLIRGLSSPERETLNGSIGTGNDKKTIPYNSSFEYALTECIKSISEKTSLKKLIRYYSINPQKVDRTSVESITEFITDRLASFYNKDKSILKLVIKLITSFEEKYLFEKSHRLVFFFDRTDTRLLTYKKVFAIARKRKNYEGLVSRIADKECIDFALKEAERLKYSHEELRSFLFGLHWHGSANQLEIYKYADQKIKDQFGNIYGNNSAEIHENRKSVQLKKDIALLFNAAELLKEVKSFFERENIQHLDWDQLHKLIWERARNNSDETELTYDSLLYRVLSVTRDGIVISYAQIEKNYSDPKRFEWFRLHQIVSYLKVHPIEIFTPVQIEWIKEWCFREINDADFSKAIVSNSDGGITTYYTPIYLGKFYKKFSFQFPLKKILEMFLMVHYENNDKIKSLSDVILERVNHEAIKKRILLNLKHHTLSGSILENHINICEKLVITDAMPSLLKEFRNGRHDALIRKMALETFIKLGGVPSDLRKDIKRFEINDQSIYWIDILTDFFISKDDSDELEKRFLKISSKLSPDNKYFNYVYNALLKLGNVKGIEMFISGLKQNANDYYHRFSIQAINYHNLPFEESCSLLLDALIYFKEDHSETSSWTIHSIKNFVFGLAENSFEKTNYVKKLLSDLILKGTESIGDYKLRYWIKEIDEHFYRLNERKMSLEEIIALNNTLKY